MLSILFCPEDGANTFLGNSGKNIPDYMLSHPRRRESPRNTIFILMVTLILCSGVSEFYFNHILACKFRNALEATTHELCCEQMIIPNPVN
jgi:hypothetical protein